MIGSMYHEKLRAIEAAEEEFYRRLNFRIEQEQWIYSERWRVSKMLSNLGDHPGFTPPNIPPYAYFPR